MDPHPRLTLLPTPATPWQQPCSALICLEGAEGLSAEVAIIGPADALNVDGHWTANPTTLKALKKSAPDAQFVGLAHDRHSAMVLGEAGADLILFGTFQPLAPGDLELARWWAELFEIPYACLVPAGSPVDAFGQPGQPEFYLEMPS